MLISIMHANNEIGTVAPLEIAGATGELDPHRRRAVRGQAPVGVDDLGWTPLLSDISSTVLKGQGPYVPRHPRPDHVRRPSESGSDRNENVPGIVGWARPVTCRPELCGRWTGCGIAIEKLIVERSMPSGSTAILSGGSPCPQRVLPGRLRRCRRPGAGPAELPPPPAPPAPGALQIPMSWRH